MRARVRYMCFGAGGCLGVIVIIYEEEARKVLLQEADRFW